MTLLVTFHSVGDALHARMLLSGRGDGGGYSVVPVPRSVSSSCGYALEVTDADEAGLTALTAALDAAGAQWHGVHRPAGDGEGGGNGSGYELLVKRATKGAACPRT